MGWVAGVNVFVSGFGRDWHFPAIETVSQYRSWFENLTTNGIARSRIQFLIRSP
jgi:hypothetical protein